MRDEACVGVIIFGVCIFYIHYDESAVFGMVGTPIRQQ